MKVLLINGGPYEDGCINLALKEVSKALNEGGYTHRKIIWLGNKGIAGGIGCNSCIKNVL